MEKRLVMFTKTFPYGNGEAFIEAEIQIASQKYKEILLFCCQVKDINSEPRKIPTNVIVIPIQEKSKKELFFKAHKYFAQKDNRIEIRREWKRNKGIKKQMFSLYFYIKSIEMFKSCEEHFQAYKAQNNKENIFYIFYSYWFFDTAYAASLMPKRFGLEKRSKVVTRSHGYDLYKERNPMGYFPFREVMLKRLNAVYACSQGGKQYLQKEYPEFAEKIKYSYLGTENRSLHFPSKKEGVFHIVTCSYIVPVKRVIKVAQACKLLENSVDNIKWTCIGDGELKQELVEYCKENLKKTQVDFKGFCSNQKVHEFYKQEHIDVFINVSSSEGLPVSIMEAMSYGIPAVATNVGGTSEIVQNDKNGYLIEKNFEINDLYVKLLDFSNLELNHTEQMRAYCKKFWEKNFEAQNNYEKFFEEINIES